MEDELVPGCYIKCKIIGALETTDDKGTDPKIIMRPCKKVDPKYSDINDIDDLHKTAKNKILYFFTHYKDLENKKVEIGNWLNADEAIMLYKSSSIN